ncbi:MAG: phycobiliprotein lyase [Cyanobacteria bacterium J06614_10]
MEIVNFFEKLAGRWFSQRTTHALSTQQSKAGKSDLEVEFLEADAAEVQSLCQTARSGEAQLPEAAPLCGLRIQQNSTIEGDTQAKQFTTLLVPLVPTTADNENYSGTLLRTGTAPNTHAQGTYTLEDEVLTIVTESSEAQSTERLWFINDNLRMRTGMTELASGLRIASFCSEIRLGVKPPKQD